MTNTEQQLWCVRVVGPDDLHAAPSKAEAERAADLLNEHYRDDSMDPPISFEAIPWPLSKEAHADNLREPVLRLQEDHAVGEQMTEDPVLARERIAQFAISDGRHDIAHEIRFGAPVSTGQCEHALRKIGSDGKMYCLRCLDVLEG